MVSLMVFKEEFILIVVTLHGRNKDIYMDIEEQSVMIINIKQNSTIMVNVFHLVQRYHYTHNNTHNMI